MTRIVITDKEMEKVTKSQSLNKMKILDTNFDSRGKVETYLIIDIDGIVKEVPYSYIETPYIDFSDYELTNLLMGGVAPKLYVKDPQTGKQYMLKFPREKIGIVRNDHITEYLACKIAKKLKFKVQEVTLGYYKGRECVGIEIFFPLPISFGGLGKSTLSHNPINYNLDWILSLKDNRKLNTDEGDYVDYVWKVFSLDLLIGNYDRHENNWGFQKFNDGRYELSPLYDLGSSFYSKFSGDRNLPKNENEIKHLIQFQTKSAILYKDKKKNYFEFIDIFRDNKVFIKNLGDTLDLYKNIDLKILLNEISNYNVLYVDYMEFIENMMDIKMNLLRDKGVIK